MKNKSHIVFGIHAVKALVEHHPENILELKLLANRQDQKITSITALAKTLNIPTQLVSRSILDEYSAGANHQGIVALCKQSDVIKENDLVSLLSHLTEPPFLLILDGVQDPHNLGACLRTADAAGVHAVIVPKDKAVGITSVVSKVASGAAEQVPFIQVTNLARTLSYLKEQAIWIYGAAGEAKQSLYQAKLTGPLAIVLGAEGSGLRHLTKEHCDVLLHIPMHGSVSSLNVSVATGVFLFEAVRQRRA